MSFQPKQNNNNSELPDGQVEEGAPLSLDEAVQSSQLETILGRINAIMTDGVPGASSEGSPAHSNEQVKSRNETVDAVAAPGEMTKNPLPESQNSIAQADVQRTEGPGLSETPAITEQSAIEGQEQFQSSEPIDMLQPYSEVLNEVRDYFHERHSLDPNDRLTSSQRTETISEEVLGATPPVQEEIKRPKKVLLWGDNPLDPASSKDLSAFSTDHKNDELSSSKEEEITPADFGFEDRHEKDDQQFDTSSSGAQAHMVDDPSQIFTPIKFENPFNRSQNAVDVLGPEDHSGHFKELRHELVDRISQLEQVIGHHFGDRKEIANEAAQAAMKLALNNLDDTSLGRRLADIEAAFVLYQKNQAQKNQETRETIEQLGKALMKMDAGSQISDRSSDLPKLEVETRAQFEPSNQPLAPKKEAGACEMPVSQTGKTHVPLSDLEQKPSKSIDAATRGSDYRVDDIQLPKGLPVKEGDVKKKDNLSASIPDTKEEPVKDEKLAQSSPQQVETDGSGADTIAKLRQAMSSSASERSFGKSQPKDDMNVSSQNMSALQPGVNPVVAGDDFLAKSASLRDQFKTADFVSNDSDLERMQPRGVKVVVGVVVVTLLLAATGIAFRDNAKGLQETIFNIVATLKGVVGLDGGAEGNVPPREVSKAGPKTQKLKDQTVQKSKSNDRLGTLTKNTKATGDVLSKDPDITGNITSVKQGLDGKVIDLTNIDSGQKLGMPPALIGPYSLRLAAARGDVRAGYEVARRFSYGLGVPKDAEQAIKWYMQGASKGFAPSQYRLATYYERGRGVEKNLGRARVWYQRAAMLGNVKAMHNLAVISTALDKDKTDYKTAIYWFKHAANRNLADSQFNLAILYQNGVGLEKNLVDSYKWFSLAARQGDIDAAARRDKLEKNLKKEELLLASQLLQKWKPLAVDPKANDVGRISTHITSTMSHAKETVTRSRTLTAQILLRKLGYVLKNADGSMNEDTIRAVKKFEKDRGMPITGKVNPELIQALNKASL